MTKSGFGRIAKILAGAGGDAAPGTLGTYSSVRLGSWE